MSRSAQISKFLRAFKRVYRQGHRRGKTGGVASEATLRDFSGRERSRRPFQRPQWRKWRIPVRIIAIPCSSTAFVTSGVTDGSRLAESRGNAGFCRRIDPSGTERTRRMPSRSPSRTIGPSSPRATESTRLIWLGTDTHDFAGTPIDDGVRLHACLHPPRRRRRPHIPLRSVCARSVRPGP